MKGKIKKYFKDKAFGFIKTETGDEYFFHRTEMKGGLTPNNVQEGDEVEFTDEEGPKGPKAVDVYPGS